jgi:hypothetical protein
MTETAKEAAGASLSGAWWRWIIPDPAPPWLFEQLGDEVRQALIEDHLRTQQAVLQEVAKSLGRQAEIIAKKKSR